MKEVSKNEHLTCVEWMQIGHDDVFVNSGAFKNGECMRYLSIGLVAFYCFAAGLALIMISLSLWVFGFVTSEESCQRIVNRLFYEIYPDERFLLIQVLNWLQIPHGKVKIQ